MNTWKEIYSSIPFRYFVLGLVLACCLFGWVVWTAQQNSQKDKPFVGNCQLAEVNSNNFIIEFLGNDFRNASIEGFDGMIRYLLETSEGREIEWILPHSYKNDRLRSIWVRIKKKEED